MDTYKVLTEDDKHVTALWPEELLWLPTSDDVLEMLEGAGIDDVRVLTTVHVPGRPGAESYLGICDPLDTCLPRAYGETRLIALMELLKATEDAKLL